MQAKDISDVELIKWIDETHIKNGKWINTWDFVGSQWDEPEVPYKVLWAKLAKLIKRGLIDGCACGCRGDFTVTSLGKRYIKMQEFDSLLTSTDDIPDSEPRHAKKDPNVFRRFLFWLKAW